MVKAYLVESRRTTSKTIYTIECPELGLSISDPVPSCALCREIMDKFPEWGNEKLEVYRDDTLAFTTPLIKEWAEKTIKEEDKKGLRVRKYIPFGGFD